MKKHEIGIMTIEAAVGLLMSVILFFSISTTALTMKTESYLQQILFNSTKEAAQYLYVLSKTSSKDVSKEVNDLVNLTLTLSNGIQQGKQRLEPLNVFEKEVVTPEQTINKETLLSAVLSSQNNRYITQSLAKYLFKSYLPEGSDSFKNQFLKNMGVLGGLDGISFAGSFVHTKQRTSDVTPHNLYITFEISYRLRGMYYHQFDYYHTIKNSVTLKVRTGDK